MKRRKPLLPGAFASLQASELYQLEERQRQRRATLRAQILGFGLGILLAALLVAALYSSQACNLPPVRQLVVVAP
ncbi:MAG: hypothetical protein EOO16_04475 [Chitinophagaceae bacterium]|nr:MAG: hypothetical protein EOO16_04475 [Chitinophagaceae bacterium]